MLICLTSLKELSMAAEQYDSLLPIKRSPPFLG